MKEENAALCRALSSLTGISVSPIYPDSPEQFYEEACAARFCRQCPYQQKNEFNTHLYGLSEAYRWDGHFIYYCPRPWCLWPPPFWTALAVWAEA